MDRNQIITSDKPILIVGAGPAGLLLGLYLDHHQIPFQIIEKMPSSHHHSRAIGIHPVALDMFKELGLIDSFLSEGVKIRYGAAFWNRGQAGTIDFSSLPHEYPFILSLPQHQTEDILRQTLLSRQSGSISYSTELHSFRQSQSGVVAQFKKRSSQDDIQTREKETPLLIGCDGKESSVRADSNARWEGNSYPDTYIMGDFENHHPFRYLAIIYLSKQGVIESFELPGERRRWVVKWDGSAIRHIGRQLSNLVFRRIGIKLDPKHCVRSSFFGVGQYMASSLWDQRCILAGDAAHVVSPIGGQGMNLGWMGVRLLSHCLRQIYHEHHGLQLLEKYDTIQRRRAYRSMRRAAFNMKLGRSFKHEIPRRILLHILLNTPIQHITARAFTMHGLDRWPF